MAYGSSLLKIAAKVAACVLRDSRKFSGHPALASRGHLCGSSAFLFYRGIAPLTPGIHASVAAADVVATVIDGYKYRDVPIGSVQMTVV